MVLRSIATTEDTPFRRWEFYQDYRVDPPYEDRIARKRVTSDIIESHNTGFDPKNIRSRNMSGDFLVIKRSQSNSSSYGKVPKHYSVFYNDGGLRGPDSSSSGAHFYGVLSLMEDLTNLDMPMPSYSSKATLATLGTTAIARSLPTNPLASLTQTIAEMFSEGMLSPVQLDSFRGKTAAARNAGSGYLNYSFGWAPMAGDVEKMLQSCIDIDDVIKEYVANSNKLIKASYHFPDKTETKIYDKANFYLQGNPHLPIMDNERGTCAASESYITKQWFEGAFTYYLPDKVRDRTAYYSALANRALGTRLTPETLWNLAPWSWAMDWASNIGDVVHNINAFQHDGLTLVRGFMMETCTVDWNETLRGLSTRSHGPVTFHLNRNAVSKQRVQVHPYTFGTFWDGLTTRQKATAAALGLARTANHP